MSYLAMLLAFKIGVTAVTVSAPMLLAPSATLAQMTRTEAAAVPWLRLYGVAVTALLVGYASGFWSLAAGQFPWGVVIMGIVSNAGAATGLIATGLARKHPLSAVLFGGIALALIASALLPSAAMRAVF